MKKGILLGITVLFAASLWAQQNIQPLDVKLGLWETTYVTQMSGLPPIPPEMLAKMTPEQKAKMAMMMKEREAEGPKTHTDKKCVTKEDLSKAKLLGEQKDCTTTVLTSTPRKLEAKMECHQEGGNAAGNLMFEAVDSSNVKGTVHMVANGGGNTMTYDTKFTSKYVSASCGDVK